MSDTLVPRTMEAARRTGYGKVAVAGGVAANSRIRADLERACRASGHRLYLPALSLCGDNGAMIGCQAYYEYQAGRRGNQPSTPMPLAPSSRAERKCTALETLVSGAVHF